MSGYARDSKNRIDCCDHARNAATLNLGGVVMMTALALLHPAQPTRPQTGRITQIEMPPQEVWLVSATTPGGRRIWYCRFAVTGLFPRLYGPFASKRKAVRFLDAAISTLSESLTELDAVREEHTCEGEFQKLHWGPLIEHPLLNADLRQTPKKGR